ncbi:FtsX-like permease family protein [Actinokineospora auranticolor]|uniref:FtsX-like permease family protein n=1 Tax=Actinokineospora auranticolor TaxID=155976 RepID=A0A2S6GHC4_9PSEU|nr:FtsX-like permease family protein [Actinokineospora auranticolor]PPK64546.1 FtsX-like permease family protein [Actinokineospora auranticolor]
MRSWLNDLAIGVRLAVGGGRTALARFVLSTIGIGLAVAVLLLASSVGPILDARDVRATANQPIYLPVAGVAPTRYMETSTEFRSTRIGVTYLQAFGATSPVPIGIPRLPGTDEMFVSPAMADLLADPLLRERFPQRIAGVIDRAGIKDPLKAQAYLGADDLPAREVGATQTAYGFRQGSHVAYMDAGLLLLLLLGTIAILVPVFIFLVSSTRIAGAERDRRLSALRLAGAGDRQVRRIAAAESLVSAGAGLALGGGLFLLGREVAGGISLMGSSVYSSDIVPVWWLAVLVVLSAPVLAVFAAQFALRRTIIEPLGVVRRSTPVNRRIAWRLAMIAVGVLLLLWRGGEFLDNTWVWSVLVATGVTLLLLGVPALLPWVVERTVRGLRGGSTSWQLAVRRLQLDSGTSSRVVSGVVVVLAGAIALQAMLLSQARIRSFSGSTWDGESTVLSVSAVGQVAPEVEKALAATPSAHAWSRADTVDVQIPGLTHSYTQVVDCSIVAAVYGFHGCVDGHIYAQPGLDITGLEQGKEVAVLSTDSKERAVSRIRWTVPVPVERVSFAARVNQEFPALLITRAAMPDAPRTRDQVGFYALPDPNATDATDRIRAALGPLGWQVSVYERRASFLRDDQETYLTIRTGLLIGSVFTLLLAGVSLLVLAVEHIRERRRPLAVLAAGGVPNGVIARSLLWQIALPIGLGVVVAVGVGVTLAALTAQIVDGPVILDWLTIGVMTGAAAALVLLVSLLTLPFLRSATRLESLRTE